MTPKITALLALTLVLAACGGNPFLEPEEPGVDPNPVEELPGTPNPSPRSGIVRYEAKVEDRTAPDNGNGFAQDFTYDADANTYTVDNLGFDGANGYTQPVGAPVRNFGQYQVYEASETEFDPQTGVAISQFQHRLVAGRSRTERTEFAIVRTGAYRNYGFGGFVMKRNDDVILPTTGQASYTGKYTGLRDFNGVGGLEYATGDMVVDIDFEDFNDGNAVKGVVNNRQIFDVNGNNITRNVLDAIDAKYDPDDELAPSQELPILRFFVGPGVMDANGEIRGKLDSNTIDTSGDALSFPVYEEGQYYAIISGENADEIVGVFVVGAKDPRFDGVTVRETGGFILYRP